MAVAGVGLPRTTGARWPLSTSRPGLGDVEQSTGSEPSAGGRAVGRPSGQ